MMTLLASKLAVVDGTDAVSAAVPMEGYNAVQADAVIFELGGATGLTVDLQGSNDRENWATIVTSTGMVLGFNAPALRTAVGWAWVRLRYTVEGTGSVIVSAGINTSVQ